jgi:protein tyrosine phosphatase (PTP) superfamily phosphohydrolase (DUF442 family)
MDENAQEALKQIRNFYSLGPTLGTSGQPEAHQFSLIRNAGYKVVLNLALHSSDHAIPNEGSIVTSLGMAYVHIPIDFNQPTGEDFATFCALVRAFENHKLFIHCAANKRVSAFLFLYRVLLQNMDLERAREDLHALWDPNPVWETFISEQLNTRSSGKFSF